MASDSHKLLKAMTNRNHDETGNDEESKVPWKVKFLGFAALPKESVTKYYGQFQKPK